MSVCGILRSPVLFFRREVVSITLLKRQISDNKIRDAEITESSEGDAKKNRVKVDLDTSLRYMKSKAYRIAYGDKPVWHTYVRNYKGSRPPPTRQTCIHGNSKLATGSPCPICRDEYLVVDYRNIDLIKQFISPHGGNIIDSK